MVKNYLTYVTLYCLAVSGISSQHSDDDEHEDVTSPSFWLFNRNIDLNGKQLDTDPTIYWNVDMIGFNQRDTKVLFHGWSTDRFSRFSTHLKDVYLQEMDVNVINVDWGGVATQTYQSAIDNLNSTAMHVATFINYLSQHQHLDTNRVHFIGYGLGAHLAGLAGKMIKPKISAITALDPVSQLSERKPKERLSPYDAQFVEVIHTGSRRFIGPTTIMGHADFFPNGGKLQPGCGIDALAHCSGERSIDLFISSIKATKPVFIGDRCDSVLQAVQRRCSSIVKARMGGKQVTKKYGIYSVTTTGESPFY